jgi:hypothetical protein
VLRVPASYKTIQAAVNAARPRDLVLISPGVYHEDVTVAAKHDRIVLRGLDRNRVVLDGQNQLGDGIAVHANGVAVENLTVHNYLVNGVVWSPPTAYSAATNNTVRANRLEANAVGLALETASGSSAGNCFVANQASQGRPRSVPARLQELTGGACGRSVAIGHERLRLVPPAPEVNYETVPAPPAQPDMPAAATTPAQPAVRYPERETGG